MNKAKRLVQIVEQEVKKIPRISMRKSVYRDKTGFTVSVSETPGWEPSHIFFTQEDQAKEYIRRRKAGEDSEAILKDIWGINKKKKEMFSVVPLQLGTSKWV